LVFTDIVGSTDLKARHGGPWRPAIGLENMLPKQAERLDLLIERIRSLESSAAR
jgi:hypothetical protein